MAQPNNADGPRKRTKRPRVIAPPQHLSNPVALTGSYTPVQHSKSVDEALAKSQHPKAPPEDPLAGLRAKDEDPHGWGDGTEDLIEAMKREKPPHWG
ncbi:hypothetical protein [Glutamicibacter sp.]|uniref:hypothetical protein n=1 Tax=Glutamicibacter sp. TaxID=1931995 RepID=UPI0028BE161D|nr:hypothetical protein [Glutamicibacter sp.]